MIHYEKFGSGPIKLIGFHGWFGNVSTYAPLQTSFDPDTYECAWLDQRGYAESRTKTGNYTMSEMAQDGLAVADALGWDSFAVIGHSMGGKAAQICAARNKSRVTKLILFASVPPVPVPFDPETRGLFDAVASSMEARIGVIRHSVGGRLSEYWVKSLAQVSADRCSADVQGAYLKSWADDDVSGEVAGLDTPTLICCGEFDPVISPDFGQNVLAGFFSNATVETIHNSAHYPLDEAPLNSAAVLDVFLRR